jgi:hypothetical protein
MVENYDDSHNLGSHVYEKINAVNCCSSHIDHNMRNCGSVGMSLGSCFIILIKNLAHGVPPLIHPHLLTTEQKQD